MASGPKKWLRVWDRFRPLLKLGLTTFTLSHKIPKSSNYFLINGPYCTGIMGKSSKVGIPLTYGHWYCPTFLLSTNMVFKKRIHENFFILLKCLGWISFKYSIQRLFVHYSAMYRGPSSQSTDWLYSQATKSTTWEVSDYRLPQSILLVKMGRRPSIKWVRAGQQLVRANVIVSSEENWNHQIR